MGKSKETERQLAEHYYCFKGMLPQDVATKIGVSRSTIDRWTEAHNWKTKRAAIHSGKDKRLARLDQLLDRQVEKLLELENNPEATDDALAKLEDRLSKTNKTIQTAREEMDPPLNIQLKVIEDFMDALMEKDNKLFMHLLEFQEEYIYHLSEKLGS